MITREEMIQEAVSRMRIINIIPEAIRQFTESTPINKTKGNILVKIVVCCACCKNFRNAEKEGAVN